MYRGSSLTSESSIGSRIWISIRILDMNPDPNPKIGKRLVENSKIAKNFFEGLLKGQ
jgi:hypothetical protein